MPKEHASALSRARIQMRTTNEYLMKIIERRDSLSAYIRQPRASDEEQDRVLVYYLNRAVQIADTCFFASALQTPLLVMSRVLCEDLLMLFWISQSEERAADHRNRCVSQITRIARANVKNGRARFRRKSTGEDVTSDFLPELDRFILGNDHVQKIAESSGLGQLYDIVYRFQSLEVHGFTCGRVEDEEGLRAILCAVASMLKAMLFIAEHRGMTTTADILKILGLHTLAEQAAEF